MEDALKTLRAITIAMALAATAAAGYAGEMTLSELNAAGATLISRNDLEKLINGATLRYTSGAGLPTQFRLDEDGRYYGTIYNVDRGTGQFRGTWQITKTGILCRAQVTKGQTDNVCQVLTKANEKYYITIGPGRFGEVDISK